MHCSHEELNHYLLVWSSEANFSSVQFSRSVVSDSLWPHGLQHTRPPCSSPTPGVYSNSCPTQEFDVQSHHQPIELVMPSNHLILCHPLLLPPSIFPSIRIFSGDEPNLPPCSFVFGLFIWSFCFLTISCSDSSSTALFAIISLCQKLSKYSSWGSWHIL